ncbi:hypothetical protein PCANC_15941 [Puccinia coronata f. sp. avenae]|uniref:Major facilitator superfamily (MFS) profile domain-containing protein n=1 Tax=Puccinia coronata f. sp. avenae TaxID=200324 RepID=A0A2N5SPG9_9BASI|nr:hypothetical protein PCANC_15941 [Puccinia coronata f. sp. avenae]
MATTSIPGLISKVVPKPLRRWVRREETECSKERAHRSKSKSLQAFGDFFVRENRSTGIKAERPSKYTSFTLSEDFKREAEKVYVTKLINSATWKMDLRLLPIMALFYFLSELGRLSINNIRSIGLQSDLKTDDSQYALSLIVNLIPLILVEIPSNFIMRRIGARIFFPLILTISGLVIFLHGFLSNFSGLLVARFFAGLVNGGLFPGFLLYLSSFYTRAELQWRIALFYCTGCFAGGLSGSFSYAITRLDGTLGLAGWAWVFIVDGILTILGGSLGFVMFPASPDDSYFLTVDEKQAVSERLHRDLSPVTGGNLLDAKPFRSSGFQISQAILSPHVGLCCLAFFFAGTNVTSLTYLQSSILNSYGHAPSVSQALSIPPYALAILTVLLSSYLSDRYQCRAMASVVSGGVTAIGYSMLYISDNSSLKYGSLFLTVIGSYGVIPCLAAWMSNNSEPYARKATSLALGPIAANFGGLIATLLFPNPDQSSFNTAIMVNIVFAMLVILSCLANLGYLTYVGAVKIHRRDEVLQHYALNDQTVDQSVQELLYLNGWEYLGDRHPDFKYSF